MKIKEQSKQKQGVSLIVLVITIIIMIILAAAVIISLSNSGIIGKANEAVEETNLKQVQQIAQTIWADVYLENKEKTEEKKLDYQTEVINRLVAQNIDATKYNINADENGVIVTKRLVDGGSDEGENEILPIKWNTLDVVNNPQFEIGGTSYVKVSNLTPNLSQMVSTSITMGETSLDYVTGYTFSFGTMIFYGSSGEAVVLVVTTSGENTELGMNIPETGIYVLNYGIDGTNIDITLEAPNYKYDYVYNTVNLPALPDWDKTAYPYASISYNDISSLGEGYEGFMATLLLFDELPMTNDGVHLAKAPNMMACCANNEVVKEIYVGYDIGIDEWGTLELLTLEDGEIELKYYLPNVWTSHDILNADDTIYLSASEPVKVRE